MKLKTQVEYLPQGHSQSNPAERAIQTVRRLGNTLLEEVRTGAKIQLPSSHVLFSWAYGHAAWLYNRYNVGPNKQTPLQRIDLTGGDLLHLVLQCMVNRCLTNSSNDKGYQHGERESLLKSYLIVILQSCVATKDCLFHGAYDVVLKNGNQIS